METADAHRALGYAYRSGTRNGVAQNECTSVEWFRKAAEQGDDEAQRVLSEWDTTLGDVGMRWQVIYP
jgi:TPR repeat protein